MAFYGGPRAHGYVESQNMNYEESDEQIESTASGLEPMSLSAVDELARAEKRAKTEAARSDSRSEPLRRRMTRELCKLVGR
jgi:hypothetical protein